MSLLGKVIRYMSEKLTSVEHDILLYQEGKASSKINTAYTFIPCGIANPTGVQITPVTNGSVSANPTAFAAQAEVLSLTSFSALSDLDAWAQNVAYEVGTIVKNPDANTAYICNLAHTSTTGGTAAADWATDLAAGYWTEVKQTNFLKVIHAAAGASKVASFTYKIEGYN